jgi:hypothetical protein
VSDGTINQQGIIQPRTETTITVRGFGTEKTAVLAAVETADLAESSKRKYLEALAGYLEGGNRITDANALTNCVRQLPSLSARRHLQAAVDLGRDAPSF